MVSSASALAQSSRRRASRDRPVGAADRVRRTHEQTARTLRLALAFMAAAVVAAAVPDGEGRWLPLHLFLAGGVVLAISGVTLMLTVTWSAAPAPAGRVATVQRWSVAGGAAGVVVGRVTDVTPVLAVGGAAFAGGLVLLAWLLVVTGRRGVERRFDAAIAAYVLAVLAGLVAAGLGVAMGAGGADGFDGLREAHLTLNLLGQVGLVIAGTLPFFVATSGRSKMARRATTARMLGSSSLLAVAVGTAAVAFVVGAGRVAGAALLLYAAAIAATGLLVPRPTRRQLQWAGPRLVALWLGAAWWAAAVAASGLAAVSGDGVLRGRSLEVLVVGGFAQILWGGLAYLLPVLRGGGHERLSRGFAITRSWPGLACANGAAIALVVGARPVAGGLVIALAIDTAVRVARMGGIRRV